MTSSNQEPPRPRDSVVVIRAWNETGTAEGFRARITMGLEEPVVTTASEPEQVIEAVKAWLKTLT
jgi:hypothetical protein